MACDSTRALTSFFLRFRPDGVLNKIYCFLISLLRILAFAEYINSRKLFDNSTSLSLPVSSCPQQTLPTRPPINLHLLSAHHIHHMSMRKRACAHLFECLLSSVLNSNSVSEQADDLVKYLSAIINSKLPVAEQDIDP